MKLYTRVNLCILPLCTILIASCAPLNDGGYGNYGYDRDDYYQNRRYQPSENYYRDRDRYRQRQEWDRIQEEQDKIEDERRRLDDERLRIERDRQRVQPSLAPPPAPPARPEERCPRGFSPSEQKCSREERKRGCQDMRLPGGLGCVKR
jgi:hypothetical protein